MKGNKPHLLNDAELNITFQTPAPPKFNAHIDQKTMAILAISPILADEEGKLNLPIEYSLAEKFLTGQENIFQWAGMYDENILKLMKKKDLRLIKQSRTKNLKLYEVTSTNRESNVVIEIFNKHLEITYNGDEVKKAPIPLKLYVTGEQNPAKLKCTLSLSANMLDAIMTEGGLSEWPNPIKLPIDDPEDISIYTIESNMTIAVIRNENINNRL